MPLSMQCRVMLQEIELKFLIWAKIELIKVKKVELYSQNTTQCFIMCLMEASLFESKQCYSTSQHDKQLRRAKKNLETV